MSLETNTLGAKRCRFTFEKKFHQLDAGINLNTSTGSKSATFYFVLDRRTFSACHNALS